MEINVGDDIVLAGTVSELADGHPIIETANGNTYRVDPKDIKSIAPGGNGGGGKRAIIKEDRCITKTTK